MYVHMYIQIRPPEPRAPGAQQPRDPPGAEPRGPRPCFQEPEDLWASPLGPGSR